MSDVNRTLTSLLLSHTICRHFWRIVVIEVSYILEWIFVFLEAQLVAHLIVELLFLNVFADLGFISTYCIDRTGVKDALDAPCAQRSGIILAVFTSSG